MKLRNRINRSLLMSLFIIMAKQVVGQGIIFEKDKGIDQLLAQAKAEHKYLFVDCYATWCGPCKRMDQEIYTDKRVGSLFAGQFIAAKIQMDRTATDSPEIKYLYGTASDLAKTYLISAYPSFLFFDPEGKAVHKEIGYKTVEEFIKLAADARDPAKQYYSLLKKYQSGKLDTAELKSLAKEAVWDDKILARKMAADYLDRIPADHLDSKDKLDLMIQMSDSPEVFAKTVDFLKHLSKAQLSTELNLSLIEALHTRREIRDLAVNYMKQLNHNEFIAMINTHEDLINSFQKDPDVQQIAQMHINRLAVQELNTKALVEFITAFTEGTNEKGFRLVYDYPERINAVMGDNAYAEKAVTRIISETEFQPLFEQAKKSNAAPDWKLLHNHIAKKYAPKYAEMVELNGKLNWYRYLTKTTGGDKYWTPYIACRLEQIRKFRYDTVQNASYFLINQIAWTYGFIHATDMAQLKALADYMKAAVDRHSDNYQYLDTYACLLYKLGKIQEAIIWDKKAIQMGEDHQSPKDHVDMVRLNLSGMEKGGQFWLEKDWQQANSIQ
ncbi:MAG: thioredoxin family protein [Bacteroidota bacterium]